MRAIDTAADPQKDGRDDAKEHLIEGGQKRAPTTGLHTCRHIRVPPKQIGDSLVLLIQCMQITHSPVSWERHQEH